jgi:hypothetical protein
MTTLIKIIVASVLSLTLFSCDFDINFQPGVVGNGQVVETSRTMNASFNAIKVSRGLNAYITQSDNERVIVEADENLHDLIITEVVDNVLIIKAKKNIGRAASKKVMVTIKDLSNIVSNSGSNVYSTNTLNAQNLEVESSGGSNITLDIATRHLRCKASSGSNTSLQVDAEVIESHASSGSNITLKGKTSQLIAEASSGSNIHASDLMTESSHANASSGSNIMVNTSKELAAKASTGAGIYYSGNPVKIEKSNNSGGSITKR